LPFCQSNRGRKNSFALRTEKKMEAQGQHDPQKSTFLEREIRGRTSSDNIRVEWRIISVTELLLKFMMQAQGILAK